MFSRIVALTKLEVDPESNLNDQQQRAYRISRGASVYGRRNPGAACERGSQTLRH